MLLLAVATTVLMLDGFNRTRAQVSTQSVETLQIQGQQSIQQLTIYEAGDIQNRLHNAASLTQIAVEYIEGLHHSAPDAFQDTRPTLDDLTHDDKGNIFDERSERITDIWVPEFVNVDSNLQHHLELSNVVDTLFPALMPLSEETIALYYQTDSLFIRYYPVIGLHEILRDNYALTEEFVDNHIYNVEPSVNPERETAWDPPYIDTAGQGLMITVSTPIYFDDTYQGFIGADMSLNYFIERMDALRPTESGYGILLDAKGRIIAAPERAGQHFQTIEPQPLESLEALRNWHTQTISPEIQPIWEQIHHGSAGTMTLDVNGDTLLLAYAPLPDVDWTLITVALVDELTAEARTISGNIVRGGEQTVTSTLLTIGLLFIGALLMTAYVTRRWLLQPIESLAKATKSVATGNLYTQLSVQRNDELGDLGTAFNQMICASLSRNWNAVWLTAPAS